MARSKTRPTKQSESVVRAMSMVGFRPEKPSSAPPDWKPMLIQYRLEAGFNGGSDPFAPHPASWSFGRRTPTCDCSGFVAWCCGYSRYHEDFPLYGGYVNTDSMLQDATGQKEWFEEVEYPEPGCLIVYGAIYKGTVRTRVGHVGLVTGVAAAEWDPRNPQFDRLLVTHCSSGNVKRTGAAIQQTTGSIWQKSGAKLVRYRHFFGEV